MRFSCTIRTVKKIDPIPQWLAWARQIQALAQTGLHYATSEYDRQRYRRLQDVAAEIFSKHTALPEVALLDLFIQQSGYATPRVDVRGAVFNEGKLLMVRERSDGGWTMPGGWADVGDVPSEAAEREVWEEAGYKVKALKLVGVYDANRSGPLVIFHAYKLVFLCELLGGEAHPSVETSEVAFFEHGDIPGVLSGERTRPRHIQDAFAALANPLTPTIFD
jgi:ADP-ribose pyrophosphatase YjhB (NUDIX family)